MLSAALAKRPIDLLLNNAGIYGPRGVPVGEAFVEQVAASERKLIAVISSKMGSIADNGSGGSYLYRSSKTAVNQGVKCLSIDLAERGIGVISLHPGWVKTDMGGPNAEIGSDHSAAGLKAILQSAGPEHSGGFFNYDGSPIPW
jgi:NAD(P)-dependent dehydrogenase (short-subunit alcohol dehydrogenase family)